MKTPKGICPSCRGNRHHPLHAVRHERYAKRHTLAVMNIQRKYIKTRSGCRYCGGKLNRYSTTCDYCQLRRNKKKRERYHEQKEPRA